MLKDGVIVILQELMERGQNTDGFLAEPRIKEESDHVLELKHTVQILKERLIEREGKTSKSHKDSPEEYFYLRHTSFSSALNPHFVVVLQPS
jgi:hypothetical protein